VKSDGEIMEILAAYDLTGSLRATAELTGCSHHTVAKHVQARDAGRPIGEPTARGRVTDPYLPKIEEWIEASKGRIRADKAHEKLLALGYAGSERSPDGRSPRSRPRGGWAIPASTGPGSQSRGCGCSTTSATGQGSAG
jgi:biotin operon repressor